MASARFDLRIDGAVNDTATHAAAYTYDHDTLLALLARDGGVGVDTPDSLGRTALHYAADVQDQLQGLVNMGFGRIVGLQRRSVTRYQLH